MLTVSHHIAVVSKHFYVTCLCLCLHLAVFYSSVSHGAILVPLLGFFRCFLPPPPTWHALFVFMSTFLQCFYCHWHMEEVSPPDFNHMGVFGRKDEAAGPPALRRSLYPGIVPQGGILMPRSRERKEGGLAGRWEGGGLIQR